MENKESVESLYERVERESEDNIINMIKDIQKEKYFTPSIEDIRVGYECEHYIHGWTKYITEDIDNLRNYKELISSNRIRTPFLTKEQIKEEGWVFSEERSSSDKLYFGIIGSTGLKYSYIMSYKISTNIMCIENKYQASIFEGKCPSINEFRYINKLLGV